MYAMYAVYVYRHPPHKHTTKYRHTQHPPPTHTHKKPKRLDSDKRDKHPLQSAALETKCAVLSLNLSAHFPLVPNSLLSVGVFLLFSPRHLPTTGVLLLFMFSFKVWLCRQKELCGSLQYFPPHGCSVAEPSPGVLSHSNVQTEVLEEIRYGPS